MPVALVASQDPVPPRNGVVTSRKATRPQDSGSEPVSARGSALRHVGRCRRLSAQCSSNSSPAGSSLRRGGALRAILRPAPPTPSPYRRTKQRDTLPRLLRLQLRLSRTTSAASVQVARRADGLLTRMPQPQSLTSPQQRCPRLGARLRAAASLRPKRFEPTRDVMSDRK
jgi:hypothetical protein